MNRYHVRVYFNGDEYQTVVHANDRSEAIKNGRKKVDSVNAARVIN